MTFFALPSLFLILTSNRSRTFSARSMPFCRRSRCERVNFFAVGFFFVTPALACRASTASGLKGSSTRGADLIDSSKSSDGDAARRAAREWMEVAKHGSILYYQVSQRFNLRFFLSFGVFAMMVGCKTKGLWVVMVRSFMLAEIFRLSTTLPRPKRPTQIHLQHPLMPLLSISVFPPRS